MRKKMRLIYGGVNSKVGSFLVNHLLPAEDLRSVGPIVFLDQVYPMTLKTDSPVPTGEFAHPHRGIATFSYVLSGNLSHYDSLGNRKTVGEGEIHWMKAGRGIIHDEKPYVKAAGGGVFQSLQFWINLPPAIKAEAPEYRALKSCEIPEAELPDYAGYVRVLLGTFGSLNSVVRTFGKQFIYHVKLNPKASFTYKIESGMEVAVLIPSVPVYLNNMEVGNSKIAVFDTNAEDIVMLNPTIFPVDIILFGGAPYLEPIVRQGPFVMNSQMEIAEAYRDFFDGKYGDIRY